MLLQLNSLRSRKFFVIFYHILSNSLDPDQARCFVGPNVDQNCLQSLSADDTGWQELKAIKLYCQNNRMEV